MSTESLEEIIRKVEVINERNKRLEAICERLDAVYRVENLVNRYEYLLTGGLYEGVVELFAKKTPGVRAELGNSGVYEGIESIKRLFGPGGVHEWFQGNPETGMIPGIMFAQGNMSPVIEVAKDGKTAKGLWYTFGPTTVAKRRGVSADGESEVTKPKANWLMSKRAYDFVKEDGEWKIWHYHVYFMFYCPFYTSWADQERAPIEDLPVQVPEQLGPDKPTTYYSIYTPARAVEYIPAAPEPYETFDETFSY